MNILYRLTVQIFKLKFVLYESFFPQGFATNNKACISFVVNGHKMGKKWLRQSFGKNNKR